MRDSSASLAAQSSWSHSAAVAIVSVRDPILPPGQGRGALNRATSAGIVLRAGVTGSRPLVRREGQPARLWPTPRYAQRGCCLDVNRGVAPARRRHAARIQSIIGLHPQFYGYGRGCAGCRHSSSLRVRRGYGGRTRWRNVSSAASAVRRDWASSVRGASYEVSAP